MLKTFHTPLSSTTEGVAHLVLGWTIALVGWLRVSAVYRDSFQTPQLQTLASIVLLAALVASVMLLYRASVLLRNQLWFELMALSIASISGLVLVRWALCFEPSWRESIAELFKYWVRMR
jgi:hypothetical protein